jgi:hypothetical protein
VPLSRLDDGYPFWGIYRSRNGTDWTLWFLYDARFARAMENHMNEMPLPGERYRARPIHPLFRRTDWTNDE